jgi:hypothetical protein
MVLSIANMLQILMLIAIKTVKPLNMLLYGLTI